MSHIRPSVCRSVGRSTDARDASGVRVRRRGVGAYSEVTAGGRVGGAAAAAASVCDGQPVPSDARRCCCCSQNSQLCAEEFHRRLQEATNFPLRPFVVPFLKVCAPPSLSFHTSLPSPARLFFFCRFPFCFTIQHCYCFCSGCSPNKWSQ